MERLQAWGDGATLRSVGKAVPRADAAAKVTGSAVYTSDVRPKGLLYARVLRSPHAHARVKDINCTALVAMPGVRAVLTRADAKGIGWYQDSEIYPETVHFLGDEVAAVAAETDDIASDAVRAITVTYEALPHVVEGADSVASGAPRVREGGNTGEEPKVTERGDSAAAFATDGTVTVEAEYTTQRAVHNSLEPHGTTAAWDGEHLTLWDSTQAVFAVQRGVAEALGLPLHNVRVIKQYMGGGFGAKQIAWKNACIAALLARKAGQPVQLMLDREAENLAAGHRNATRQRVRLCADRDGHLLAIGAHIEQDVGAYQTGGEASDTAGPYLVHYRCSNVRTEQVTVFTNTGPAVAFRAPGYAEAAFALESAMDELARELDLDPLELRRRNYAETDQVKDKPYTTPGGLAAAYEAAASAFGWDEQREPDHGRVRRGRGVAVQVWGGSGFPPAGAMVKWNPDGSVEVASGTQDIGTGTRTALAQIAAEELGVDVRCVAVHLGDTAWGLYAPTSAGSATLASVGPAVRAAAANARNELLDHAAEMLGVERSLLRATGARVECGDRGISVAEVLKDAAPRIFSGTGHREPNPEDHAVRSFGVQMAEVEVDTEVGEVRLLRLVTAQESGRVVNPALLRSQVLGGVTQGVGFALTEEQVFDHRLGVPLNANLEEYLVPTAAEAVPLEFVPVHMPDGTANSVGAKGIGEPPIIGTAPAIANAIYDATGIRFRSLPITRRRLLDALAEMQ
jgi:xanthine dehydrogenase YagR molybdenum-binding subunit